MLGSIEHDARALHPYNWSGQQAVERIGLIGLISGLLYGIVYFTQREIFLNGFLINAPGAYLLGNPASGWRLLVQGLSYYGATIALFALYMWVLRLCRQGWLNYPRARRVALLFPVAFNVGLLIGRPYLSIDMFSYLTHGYFSLESLPQAYLRSASEAARTSFGPQLAAYGWMPFHGPSPYGPIWMYFEIAVARLAIDVPTQVLLLKIVVVTASLTAAALIWTILGRIRPHDQLFGTLLYLWNPVVIVEFAAEGHNDAVMICFVLAALACCFAGQRSRSMIAMVLGFLTKYIPALLLLPQLMYLWHTRRNWRHFALHVAIGGLVGLGCVWIVFWPLWGGWQTLEGLRVVGRPVASASLAGALCWNLGHLIPSEVAAQVVTQIMSALTAVYTVLVGRRVTDAQSLCVACAKIWLFYILVASPGYWPWYVGMPLALLALTPYGWSLTVALVLTFCARLIAPLAVVAINGLIPWEVTFSLMMMIGIGVPLAVWTTLSMQERRGINLDYEPIFVRSAS